MTTSAELKAKIVAQIEDDIRTANDADWRAHFEMNDQPLSDEVVEQLKDVKNWKRTWKGTEKIGDTTFVMRQFLYKPPGAEESEGVLEAVVTCDENDEFQCIEFEAQ